MHANRQHKYILQTSVMYTDVLYILNANLYTAVLLHTNFQHLNVQHANILHAKLLHTNIWHANVLHANVLHNDVLPSNTLQSSVLYISTYCGQTNYIFPFKEQCPYQQTVKYTQIKTNHMTDGGPVTPLQEKSHLDKLTIYCKCCCVLRCNALRVGLVCAVSRILSMLAFL